MNKLLSIIVILVLVFMPQSLFAHPEPGFGFVNAEDQGKLEINRLVEEKVLPQTWNSAYSELDLSGTEVIKGKKRWAMVYRNADEVDQSKALIKIIMTPLGKFVTYEFIKE